MRRARFTDRPLWPAKTKTADWFPAPFAGYGESRNCLMMIKGRCAQIPVVRRAQLRETGVGQLQPARKVAEGPRLARSDKPVQIFPGIPPLTFTAAVCNCERGAESDN